MKSRIYNNPKNEAKNADRERRRILESFDKQKISDYIRNVLNMNCSSSYRFDATINT